MAVVLVLQKTIVGGVSTTTAVDIFRVTWKLPFGFAYLFDSIRGQFVRGGAYVTGICRC